MKGATHLTLSLFPLLCNSSSCKEINLKCCLLIKLIEALRKPKKVGVLVLLPDEKKHKIKQNKTKTEPTFTDLNQKLLMNYDICLIF